MVLEGAVGVDLSTFHDSCCDVAAVSLLCEREAKHSKG